MDSNLGDNPEEISVALESVVRALPCDVLLNLIGLLLEREHLSSRSRDALTSALFMPGSTHEADTDKDREALLVCIGHLPPDEQREVSVAVFEAVALPEH